MADEAQKTPSVFAPLYAAVEGLFGTWITEPLAAIKAGSRKMQMAFAATFAAVLAAGTLWHYGVIPTPRFASATPPAYATAGSVSDLAAVADRIAESAASKADVAELAAMVSALSARVDRIESAFRGRRPIVTGSIKRRPN